MADNVPPPILEDLVPPLLAHLPTAFASKTPPDSLFPLLAPILRNRIRLLLDPTSSDSWVSLLTWNHTNGQALDSHLSTLDLGAIADHALLRGLQRTDEETLKASAELCDWGLVVDYTWCTNDADGEDDGWRVLDVHLSDCSDDASQWYPSVSAAEEAFAATRNRRTLGSAPSAAVEKEETDDDYWNMYDQSSPTTPAPRETEEPDEDTYFDRYNDVEPVLGSSCSHGDEENECAESHRRYSSSNNTAVSMASTPPTAVSSTTYTAPRPISADSGDFLLSKLASRLEESVADSVQAEVAAKQHVSTSIKSLFRLCRAVGIEQEEFHSMVETELAMLSMMDHDE